MPVLRILVVDGNTRRTDEAHVAAGGVATGEHYARVLRSLHPGVECSVLHAARTESAALPAGMEIAHFHGVAWTGSALNVYDDGPAVRAQVELCRAVFEAGVPQFGSCWGLQVAAVAAGGQVRPNPLGRELGIARRIRSTVAGSEHPLLAGKGEVFEAIAVHMDEVNVLPQGSTLLAGNAMSAVQAAEIRYRGGVCWATQYHPEYDLNEIATVILRYGRALIEAGFFADMPALNQYADDLRRLHADPSRADLAWRYGLGIDVLDPGRRHSELRQWLNLQALPRAEQGA